MKPYILIMLALISITCFAQTTPDPTAYEAKENLKELGSVYSTGTVRTFDNRYEGVKGSPFVFEEFRRGEVFLKNKNKVIIQDLNYNCFENEISFKDPATDAIRLLNKFQVDLFTIQDGDKELTFVPLKLEEDAEAIFAELLYNQGSVAYKVYKKEWVKANYEGGYSADRPYDEFVDKYDLYFLKKGDNTLYKAKKSKKQVLAAFPDQKSAISSFYKSNKLDLREEESLVKLLKYYDSLNAE